MDKGLERKLHKAYHRLRDTLQSDSSNLYDRLIIQLLISDFIPLAFCLFDYNLPLSQELHRILHLKDAIFKAHIE